MRAKLINSKIIAGVIVLGIVCFLIISGPANAFITELISSKTVVNKGETVTFNASLKTEEGEKLSDIDSLTFRLKGINNQEDINCNFKINGEIIEGCLGINIKVINPEGYGYCDSYGYGSQCETKYVISLNTAKVDAGEYETFFIIDTKSGEKAKQGKNLLIIDIIDKQCSIRANKGTLVVDNFEFTNSRINFYIPFKKAAEGDGYITGQLNRNRFSYKFKVNRVIENSDKRLRAEISGTYRLGTKDNLFEKAVINFDKTTGEISVIGDKIKYTDGSIYFRQGC